MSGGSENLIQFGTAFAHALFDGLWIGIAVAIAVHLYLRSQSGLNAASRHAAWYAALLVIAVMPVFSFGSSLARISVTPIPAQVLTFSSPSHSLLDPASSTPSTAAGTSQTSATQVSPPLLTSDVAQRAAIAIAAALAAVALARLAVLIVGLFALARVKRASRIVDPAIAPSLARTIARDSGARTVDVRVSETLETPAAAGFRTPAILLPARLVASADPDALDQIAMHEYAHLRRYDDWTNLFQRLVERFYWFNPAVWFVTSRIDLEREIACDDWAVAGVDRVSSYADCLWHLARDGRVPSFAATAPGAFLTRNQIVARIEHLLESRRDAAPFWRPAKLLAVAPVLVAAIALIIDRAPAIALRVPQPVSAYAVEVHVAVAPAAAAHALTPARVAYARTASALAVSVRSASTVPVASQRQEASPKPCPRGRVNSTITQTVRQAVAASQAAAVRQAVADGQAVSVGPAQTAVVRTATIERTVRQVVETSRTTVREAVRQTVRITAPAVREAVRQAVRDAAPAMVAAADITDNGPSGTIDRNLLMHCTGCDLSGKNLRNADLHDLALTGDDLSGADLRGANLRGAVLTGVDLSNAKLDGADLRGTVLTGTDIAGATFAGAKLDGVKLVGMQLTESILATSSARAIIGGCAGCDLSDLNLHGRDLHGITLDGVDLRGADLTDANLAGAHFNGVDLEGAKFDGADLTNVTMNGCNLQGVDLSRARTEGLTLHGSTLDGTDAAWPDQQSP